MSASLVGSEMCIRDRLWNVGGGLSLPVGSRTSSATPCSAHSGEGSIAVSYTHLTLPTICSV
eukprot:2001551-Alexandrium_andersonii.AAC.1